jgi:hypothetical protein
MTDHEHTTEDDRRQCESTFTPVRSVCHADGPGWLITIYEGEDGEYGTDVVTRGQSQCAWAYDSVEQAQRAAEKILLDGIADGATDD